MPGTDDSVSLQLQLKVPADACTQPRTLTVVAEGDGQHIALPLHILLAKELPTKLALNTKLPAIKGGAQSSFDYSLTLKNDSGKDLTVSFAAKAPQYFDTSFTEGYGSQQIRSEEHTSELQSLMRTSYAALYLKTTTIHFTHSVTTAPQ